MHGGSPWLLLTAVMAVQDVFIGNFPHGIGFIALRANLAKSSYFFGAKISIVLAGLNFFQYIVAFNTFFCKWCRNVSNNR